MKIVFLVLLVSPAISLAAPGPQAGNHAAVQAGAARVPIPYDSHNGGQTFEPANIQFQRSDPENMYSFSYSNSDSSRHEMMKNDGSVEGKYSYMDPNGKLIQVGYTAGQGGFNAFGDHIIQNHQVSLPVPVIDTPAVQAAREEFFKIYELELARHLSHKHKEETLETKIEETPVQVGESQNSASNDDTIVTSASSEEDKNQKIQHDKVNNNKPISPSFPAYFYYVGVGDVPYYKIAPQRFGYYQSVPMSLRAAQSGAIPVSAVHDVQVPHRGEGVHVPEQTPPVYIEAEVKGKEGPNSHMTDVNKEMDGNQMSQVYPFPLFGYPSILLY